MHVTEIISICHHEFENVVLRKIFIPIVTPTSLELFIMTLKTEP